MLEQVQAKAKLRSQFENREEVQKRVSPKIENAAIVGVGSAFPDTSFTQAEMKSMFGIQNTTVNKLMDSGHIEKRHLYLSKIDPQSGQILDEAPSELITKFHSGVLDIGVTAILNALSRANLEPNQVDCIVAVTSSGFAVPGISAKLSQALGMRANIFRLDIVGMGCNAGMNALQTANSWVATNPGKTALVVCCEINSAAYVKDETIRTGIVNSLFGDGAAAIVLQNAAALGLGIRSGSSIGIAKMGSSSALHLLDFESHVLTEHSDAMRFDWDETKNKWSFFLSKRIPFVVGDNVHVPVDALLQRNSLKRSDIQHWILHTGGGAVIEGMKKNLGLSEHQIRHTRSVLRDYGNLSSGSFLVSLERLIAEDVVQAGDLGVLVAMGPGSNIEAGLCRWETKSPVFFGAN